MEITSDGVGLCIREWAPLTVLNKIPTKYQSGIFMLDLSLTCVDVLPDFIALGTNAGIVFWYDRVTTDLRRLRCEGPSASITCVKVVSSVDYMVACGTESGFISVFTIPKNIPQNLPPSIRPKEKPVERYCISDLHVSPITSLEWAKNGMKLFSGDKNGCVLITEIDFYMHICRSTEILNESYEIVQLSYSRPKLLVSSVYRCIVAEKQDGKWKVCQVGKKDRKCLSHLGAIFVPNVFPRLPDNIYCSRPGHRLWVADSEGNVDKTLLFKDTLTVPLHNVPLLNPILFKRISAQEPAGFGQVHLFGSAYVVTYSKNILYVLDPTRTIVVAAVTKLRSILSLSVCGSEIFILEGQRTLIRIATEPENTRLKIDNIASVIANPIISTIKSLTDSHYSNSEQTVETYSDVESIVNAEECFELPPIKQFPLDLNLVLLNNGDTPNVNDIKIQSSIGPGMAKSTELQNNKLEVYSKISELKFEDDILFKSEKRIGVRKKSNVRNIVHEEGQSTSCNNSDDSSDTVIAQERIQSLQVNGSDIKMEGALNKASVMDLSLCGPEEFVPDTRSPETIRRDIESKEKILAKYLNIDAVKITNREIPVSEQTDVIEKEKALTSFPTTAVYKNYSDSKSSETNENSRADKSISISVPKHELTTPIAVKQIPNLWSVENVSVQKMEDTFEDILSEPDITYEFIDSDWEIL